MATDNKARIVLSAKDETAIAFAKAKAGMRSIGEQAANVDGLFGGLGVAIAAAFTGASLAGALQTLDRLDDLAEKSGIATDQLSALRFAGETAGTSFEDLAGGLRKLAKNMADAAGGGKETSAAFDAIGVKVTGLSGGLKSSNEVLLQIADAFASYQDGAGKSALATALFGKAGETLIPLLNQGSAGIEAQTRLARELGAVYSGPLAKSAADFEDNLKRINLAAEGGKVAILEKFLPGLNILAESFVQNAKNAGLFTAALLTLRNALAFDLGLDKLGTLQREASATSGEIARVTNILMGLDNVLQREPGNEAAQRRAESLRNKLKSLQDQAGKTGAAIRNEIDTIDPKDSARELQRFKGISDRNKKQAPIPDKTSSKDDSLSQFNSLMDRLKQRAEADRQQIALGRQLTDTEKFLLDIETALTGNKSKLTGKQQDLLRAQLGNVKALELELETRALLRAAGERDAAAEQDAIDRIASAGLARADENRSLFDQIALFGASAREVEAFTLKRLQNSLAVEQGAVAIAKAQGASEAELITMRENIGLLQKQIDLRGELIGKARSAESDPFEGAQRAIKNFTEGLGKAGTDTERVVTDSLKSLEDGITNILTGKTVDAKQIVDQILAEFLRLQVVKPLLAEIFGGGGSGLLSTALSFFGGFKASGGPVQAGVPVMTGERGRELFIPQTAGRIIPNSELGAAGAAPDVNNYFNIGAGVTRGEVASLLNAYGQRLKGEILTSMKNGGAFSGPGR